MGFYTFLYQVIGVLILKEKELYLMLIDITAQVSLIIYFELIILTLKLTIKFTRKFKIKMAELYI